MVPITAVFDRSLHALPRVAVAHRLDRRRDPLQAMGVDGGVEACPCRAPLDLDERDGPAAAHDQVDLAPRRFDPACDDAPTVEAQPERRQPLASAAASLGDLALHALRSSNARA